VFEKRSVFRDAVVGEFGQIDGFETAMNNQFGDAASSPDRMLQSMTGKACRKPEKNPVNLSDR